MSERSVSVVIPHYFDERVDNLPVIIRALHAGTVRPSQILIWNNSGRSLPGTDKATVIDSPENIGAKARFLAALMATGDEVLFLDNDVCPDPQTIENLLRWRDIFPRMVLTLEGRQASAGVPYARWPKYYGHGLAARADRMVEVSLGRGELVTREWLPSILARFPFEPTTVMDDLWFSACARRAGHPIRVVACVKGVSSLGNLPNGGVGLSTDTKVFYADRDAAYAEILRTLGSVL